MRGVSMKISNRLKYRPNYNYAFGGGGEGVVFEWVCSRHRVRVLIYIHSRGSVDHNGGHKSGFVFKK